VKTRTDTLEIGSRAPEFSLAAANQEGTFKLRSLLERAPVILEFLRGTW
jgi:peroxiredoxin